MGARPRFIYDTIMIEIENCIGMELQSQIVDSFVMSMHCCETLPRRSLVMQIKSHSSHRMILRLSQEKEIRTFVRQISMPQIQVLFQTHQIYKTSILISLPHESLATQINSSKKQTTWYLETTDNQLFDLLSQISQH